MSETGQDDAQQTAVRPPTSVVPWALAVVVIISGILLSWWNVLDRQWLARAGSVVVAIGIWSGLGGLIKERFLTRSYMLRRRILVANVHRRRHSDPETRQKRIEEIEQALKNRLELHRDRHRLTVGVREASLVIVGTLLWGFGDLVRYVL